MNRILGQLIGAQLTANPILGHLPVTHVGFTGTQDGMTAAQYDSLRRLLTGVENLCLHHGDDRGSDFQSHGLARELNLSVIVHPPSNNKRRAYAVGDFIREPRPYLDRNHDIVDEVVILIAAPKGCVEELRSGTWATIRYAKQAGKPVIVVFPDGKVQTER